MPTLRPEPQTTMRCTATDQSESCPNSKIQRCPRAGSLNQQQTAKPSNTQPMRPNTKTPSYQPLDGIECAMTKNTSPAATARPPCSHVFFVEKIAGPSQTPNNGNAAHGTRGNNP